MKLNSYQNGLLRGAYVGLFTAVLFYTGCDLIKDSHYKGKKLTTMLQEEQKIIRDFDKGVQEYFVFEKGLNKQEYVDLMNNHFKRVTKELDYINNYHAESNDELKHKRAILRGKQAEADLFRHYYDKHEKFHKEIQVIIGKAMKTAENCKKMSARIDKLQGK